MTMTNRKGLLLVAAVASLALACQPKEKDIGLFGDGDDGAGGDGGTDDGGADDGGADDGGGDDGGEDGDDGIRYDVGGGTGGPGDDDEPCDPNTDPDCECTIPPHEPCDEATGDFLQAMGLNCPGELQVAGSATGSAEAIGIRDHFGPTDTWDPTEGAVFTVLGSGLVADLDSETPDSDAEFQHDMPTHCNDDLGGQYDVGVLPEPLDPHRVGDVDCSQDPSLVGTGDCSNTLQEQWDAGMLGGSTTLGCSPHPDCCTSFCANTPTGVCNDVPCCEINGTPCDDQGVAMDYTELRFTVQVPPDVISFSYDLAFFTVEWPYYYDSQYNDFYVGWLESDKWTGNVSFDEQGNPISLNAAFFDFLDQDGNLPELQGTCMRYHGGTKWLTTTSGVTPGEEITVVFAIFDLSDSILDSYVFLDNWEWGCDPTLRPETKPEG